MPPAPSRTMLTLGTANERGKTHTKYKKRKKKRWPPLFSNHSPISLFYLKLDFKFEEKMGYTVHARNVSNQLSKTHSDIRHIFQHSNLVFLVLGS